MRRKMREWYVVFDIVEPNGTREGNCFIPTTINLRTREGFELIMKMVLADLGDPEDVKINILNLIELDNE